MLHFTADLHFFHRNIIDYCKRPFRDVEHMNAELIRRWNECVQPTDTIYVLGDVTFGTIEQTEDVLRQLNGHKHLILGNHDRKGRCEKLQWHLFFNTVQEHTRLKYEGMKFVLCHFPFAAWERGYINLHGHTHGQHPGPYGQHDVGVDVNDWRPITFIEARDLALEATKPRPRY